MAAPIAHIFLATQMLAGPFQGLFNEKEFIIGTSFPDIRYLKVAARAQTHITHVTLESIIKEKDSFKAGMLFHSFVDEQREAYVVENHFYEKIPSFKFTTQSLKFAEDDILKSQFDITSYISYFDKIIEQEKSFGITETNIKNWHNFLQGYFRGDYTQKDLFMKYFDLNDPDAWRVKRWVFSWYYARKCTQTMSFIAGDKKMTALILDFYLNFAGRYKTKKKS